ncbi:bifunctional glutamate N-acetyltransferase/amino-acid acetyltransferase ArgJ [Neisseria mucosa]|uniref:Arginine biosynthesis bifunctional protein ArgJ n=1 Tax=Neisseria mucosa TaxID=488 RepID=A0AAW6ZFZ9_NEIMU|nr:bifunctional glutamate N-acetyltransferase/amino-acid acetyltransferase ArgJ [Neisseria mucosa]ARC50252.1 bifunctional glutamate N-acetyltransferase/amino-acid acetyltransferase ArgJ [Neisseria mucosa]MDK6726719.1 bifunctional glutamate N-acetyltransferase/amino-acid acetyltransferase ArgJ [Neisseria mucosa]MDK6871111.1 bifunctional glutamate N-acetyltransferase/amino-acid acetyltransferase ArgJ [Neisseria mucosa]MDK8110752.1 bifunctional glutamate N-acetyltransferase/amino-acid acetyltransf
MAVNLTEKTADQLLNIDGIQLFTARAGIKQTDRADLTLMVLSGGNTVGAVFTTNRFCAAPVHIAKSHLFDEDGVRAIIINTGNANAGTGAQGRIDAIETCAATAEQTGCKPSQVLPFSTGVILEPLPVGKIVAALPKMQPADWADAARAIMTTDTVPKSASREGSVGEKHTVRATGIAKGSGMIHPNMATMLSFIATDAKVSQPILQLMTQEIADETFNTITVDGDTSTNDSFVIIATGKNSQSEIDNIADPRYKQLKDLLGSLALELAQAIVRDGEGATKFITVRVENAKTRDEARQVAYAVAHSPLVKTAFFASDPNLGRLLAAIGYAGIADLDADILEMYLDDVLVAENGGRAASYTEEQGQAVMAKDEITVRIKLHRGQAAATIYTCDLSHDYVSINADYRS